MLVPMQSLLTKKRKRSRRRKPPLPHPGVRLARPRKPKCVDSSARTTHFMTAKVRLVEEIALMHSCGPYPAARRQAENWRFRRIFNELIVSAAATRDELRARPSRRIEHVLHPLEADSEQSHA